MLLQKRVVRTKLDIYVFIYTKQHVMIKIYILFKVKHTNNLSSIVWPIKFNHWKTSFHVFTEYMYLHHIKMYFNINNRKNVMERKTKQKGNHKIKKNEDDMSS